MRLGELQPGPTCSLQWSSMRASHDHTCLPAKESKSGPVWGGSEKMCSCFQIPLMFASTLEGRSSRQLQADRRGPAPGCRGNRHKEGCQRCGFPPIRAPAHLLVGPSHHSRLQGTGWPRGRVQHPCTFGVVESGGRPPAFVGTSAPHRTFTDPAPPSP